MKYADRNFEPYNQLFINHYLSRKLIHICFYSIFANYYGTKKQDIQYILR